MKVQRDSKKKHALYVQICREYSITGYNFVELSNNYTQRNNKPQANLCKQTKIHHQSDPSNYTRNIERDFPLCSDLRSILACLSYLMCHLLLFVYARLADNTKQHLTLLSMMCLLGGCCFRTGEE